MNLKEIEEKRMSLLEQIKDLKFQERDEIEKIFKLYFSEYVKIEWYDDDENYFRIVNDNFNFHNLKNISENLSEWDIYIKAYDNKCIEIEFNRIEKD